MYSLVILANTAVLMYAMIAATRPLTDTINGSTSTMFFAVAPCYGYFGRKSRLFSLVSSGLVVMNHLPFAWCCFGYTSARFPYFIVKYLSLTLNILSYVAIAVSINLLVYN